MKSTKFTLTLVCFLVCLGYSQAQKDYNPWAKYGYTPPKALTLSNGKYQEFFDDDTIVQIGSIMFNTITNQIVGFVKQDTTYSEATLEPHIISRWLSPDPMAKERESLSPYNFVSNNPIMRIDPTGALDDNYKMDENGNIALEEKTDDKFDVLFNKDKSASIQVDKGVLSNIETKDRTTTNFGTQKYDKLAVWGEKEGNNLFEFVSKNSKVEWSIMKFGEEGMRTNILTTSHQTGAEFGNGAVLTSEFTLQSDLKGWDHSHPNGRMIPSGAQYPLYLNEERQHNDIGSTTFIQNNYKTNVSTRIFNPKDGTYLDYNSKTYIPE